jgi:hypothetical protein
LDTLRALEIHWVSDEDGNILTSLRTALSLVGVSLTTLRVVGWSAAEEIISLLPLCPNLEELGMEFHPDWKAQGLLVKRHIDALTKPLKRLQFDLPYKVPQIGKVESIPSLSENIDKVNEETHQLGGEGLT